MTQRESSGWILYALLIIGAIVATVHAWSAGSPYFGNEFRSVEVKTVRSVSDDEKTVYIATLVDQATGIEFEHDINPRAAKDFVDGGSKPKVRPMLLEIGAVDPIDKAAHDRYYLYRWVATGSLMILLFWWLVVRCEIFVIFAILD